MIPKFDNYSSQNTGKSVFKRFEFEFNGASYKFVLNPEEYQQSEPNRVQVVQTKGGAFADDFGGGIASILMKGTTGFKNGTSNSQHGFYAFKQLRDLIRSYYFDILPGTDITNKHELVFHNHTDGEHWVVIPKVFTLMRSIARPLMYAYDIQLICQRPANQPQSVDTDSLVPTLEKLEVEK